MKFCTSRLVNVLLLCLCIGVSLHAQSIFPDNEIQQRRDVIRHWDYQGTLQMVLTVAVIVFGAAITILQGLQKGWCKPATMVLGACTTIFSGLNTNVFPTDYRALSVASAKGATLIAKMSMSAARLQEATAPDDRNEIRAELGRELSEFDDLQANVNGGSRNSAAEKPHALALTRVYAAVASDPCSSSKKADGFSYYYTGINRDASLAAAKKQSREDAISNAAKDLTPKGRDPEVVRQMIATMAVVDDTSYSFDKSTASYNYCTIVRLSKVIPNLLVGAQTPAPMETKLRVEVGAIRRLFQDRAAFLYVAKVKNIFGGPDTADVYIFESAASQWNTSKMKAQAFESAISKLKESSNTTLAPESYLRRQFKKGDSLSLTLSGGFEVRVTAPAVNYILSRIDVTLVPTGK